MTSEFTSGWYEALINRFSPEAPGVLEVRADALIVARSTLAGLCAIAQAIDAAAVRIADAQRAVVERIEFADAPEDSAGGDLPRRVASAVQSTDGPLVADEPLLVLRGTDRTGAGFARRWAEALAESGEPPEVVARARQLAYEFEAWARDRPGTMGHPAPCDLLFQVAR